GRRDERLAGRALRARAVVGVDRPDGAPAAGGGRAGRQAHRRGRGRRSGDRPVPGAGAHGRRALAEGRGVLRQPDRRPASAMTGKATARAHPNLALVKYWGKRDEALVLPHQSSLSLTLAPLSVVASVELGVGEDEVTINGAPAAGSERDRVLEL